VVLTEKRVKEMPKISRFTEEQIAVAKVYAAQTPPDDLDPRIEALVNDLIGRVADIGLVGLTISGLSALGFATIQASIAAVHHHDGSGAALRAQLRPLRKMRL
jgi:hypothetical protein